MNWDALAAIAELAGSIVVVVWLGYLAIHVDTLASRQLPGSSSPELSAGRGA